VSRALPDTLAADSFLGPLQEMGIKEAHPNEPTTVAVYRRKSVNFK